MLEGKGVDIRWGIVEGFLLYWDPVGKRGSIASDINDHDRL